MTSRLDDVLDRLPTKRPWKSRAVSALDCRSLMFSRSAKPPLLVVDEPPSKKLSSWLRVALEATTMLVATMSLEAASVMPGSLLNWILLGGGLRPGALIVSESSAGRADGEPGKGGLLGLIGEKL